MCELVGQVIGRPLLFGKGDHATGALQSGFLSDPGPILDAQAKAEYKHRLDDLRGDLEEAERFNDPARAERVRSEMDALARQLALAVGLGGRNRRLGSEAERARSAVTKRIKNSINRIGEAIPSLRSHLATRVKTGYFCSYNPQPERPVAGNFDFSSAFPLWHEKSHCDLKSYAYMDMNIHPSNQLITAINPTSRSPFGRGFVLTALALASLAFSPTAWTQSSAMESDSKDQCSQESLKGPYMSEQSGTLNGLPYTQVNRVFADGNGSLTGSGTAVANGVVSFPIINGNYTINSDCTGR